MKKRNQRLTSILITMVVVAVLMIAAPAQAVLLKVGALSKEAEIDSTVTFSLGANLQGNDAIPIEEVILHIGAEECIFEVDGTPISSCDGISITPDVVTEEYFESLYGFGYDGEANTGTAFGYGYGFGSANGQGANQELTWNVEWDTTGKSAGTYDVEFKIQSSSERNFEMKKVKSIELAEVVAGPPGAQSKERGNPSAQGAARRR